MIEEKIEHPCEKCEKEYACIACGRYKTCSMWRKWLSQMWQEIRMLFGFDVSECHEEKGGDDE